MNQYTAEIDTGEGGATILTAATLADALVMAEAWAQEGQWRVGSTVNVTVIGPDGEATVGVEVEQSGIFAQ